MKENVFDVLMYLFENYMDDGPEFNPDQEALTAELAEAGFARGEIRKAFSWLEGLSQLRAEHAGVAAGSHAMRHYTAQEKEKLDAECRGFLLAMERSGVLAPLTREIVIDRAMALETDDIALEQLKWVMLMVLFNQPGQETAYDFLENMVFDEMQGHLH
jgi:Smg protein